MDRSSSSLMGLQVFVSSRGETARSDARSLGAEARYETTTEAERFGVGNFIRNADEADELRRIADDPSIPVNEGQGVPVSDGAFLRQPAVQGDR